MKKRVGIIKRLFCLLLVFLFSINSFAAVVSDNDGSAFISKAEFDSLKNSFQSQIDSYNKSIDSKIDGAIASYLAGIRTADKWTVKTRKMSFLNQWQYNKPQSYYDINFKVTSATKGLDQMAAGEPGVDYSYPNANYFSYAAYGENNKLLSAAYNYSRTGSDKCYIIFTIDFIGMKESVNWTTIENGIKAQTFSWWESRVSMITGESDSELVKQKWDNYTESWWPKTASFESVKIKIFFASGSGTSNRKTYSDVDIKTIPGSFHPQPPTFASARQLTSYTNTLNPTSSNCSCVQAIDDGGKYIIDTKPYKELKIQNSCTVDCFHYQDKSAESNFTNSAAFNDSIWNGVTLTLPEQWAWNTKKDNGVTPADVGSSTSTTAVNAMTVQNFLNFTKESTQVLKNTTWGKPSYTTNVVAVDDSLSIDKNGASTTFTTLSGGTFNGVSKYLASATAKSITTGTSTINYPALKVPIYTYKQYTQQIYDYYLNDFTDKSGEALKWGEGIFIADCPAERDSTRVKITYHIENMSGTAQTGRSCNFELAKQRFVKCVAQTGTSLKTATDTPSSTTANTVIMDIAATEEKAEMWLNAYCATDGYTVVVDDIEIE